MEQISGFGEFTSLLKQLAEAVIQAVESKMAAGRWVSATLDVRYAAAGGSWNAKIRCALPDGSKVGIPMTDEIDLLLLSLNGQRKLVAEDEWFGLFLDIDSQRKCKTELNYDPNCGEDESFFDD